MNAARTIALLLMIGLGPGACPTPAQDPEVERFNDDFDRAKASIGRGDHRDALARLTPHAEVLRRAGVHEVAAIVRAMMGECEIGLKNPEAARAHFLGALDSAHASKSWSKPDTVALRRGIASQLTILGRADEGYPVYAAAVADLRKLGSEGRGFAEVLWELGMIARGAGRRSEARAAFTEALGLLKGARVAADDDLALNLRSDLAGEEAYFGRFNEALGHIEEIGKAARARFGPGSTELAVHSLSVAPVFLALERNNEVKDLMVQTTATLERAGHPRLPEALDALGAALTALDRPREAIHPLERALKMVEAAQGGDHPSTAHAQIRLALALELAGELDRAIEAYRRAIAIDGSRQALDGLAMAEAARGRPRDAAAAFGRALTLLREEMTAGLGDLGLPDQVRLLGVQHRSLYEAALSLARAHPDDPEIVAASAEWVLNHKGLAEESAIRARGGRPTPPPASLDAVRRALPADSVLIEVARVRRLDFAAKGRNKPWGDSTYLVWLIPRAGRGPVRLVESAPDPVLTRAVDDFRTLIGREADRPGVPLLTTEARARETLAAISRAILGSIGAESLAPGRWVIAPDSATWLVPWAALPTADGRYAIEGHEIQLVGSGRELLAPPGPSPRGHAAIVAAPDFGPAPAEGLGWGPLKSAPAEADAAAVAARRIWGAVPDDFRGTRASEEAVRSLRGPRALTLITHGFAKLRAPGGSADLNRLHRDETLADLSQIGPDPLELCGLALAGANRRGRPSVADGLLTGLEVAALDLRGTDLVFLSACETGLGQVLDGQGVGDLRRAFRMAGAGGVFATLWGVEDRETAQLMAAVHGALARDGDRPTALAIAQRGLIRRLRAEPRGAHPYLWAGITFTGLSRETRP